MNILTKFVISFLVSIIVSIITGFTTVSLLGLIVDIFKINYNTGKDNYWIFNAKDAAYEAEVADYKTLSELFERLEVDHI